MAQLADSIPTPIQGKQERVAWTLVVIGKTLGTHKENELAEETPKGEPIGTNTTDQASGMEVTPASNPIPK